MFLVILGYYEVLNTQNLMANNKFSINFYYICTVL